MTDGTREVAIIGAGPAGISAAIYLKRAGIDPLVLERRRVGGLLMNANLVENYPGFPDGIAGRQLVGLFERQLRRWRIRLTRANVTRATRAGSVFRLATDRGNFAVRFLIVGTGTIPKSADLEGIETLPRGRLHYEIADVQGRLKGKAFLIIGGGDAAFDYALNVSGQGGSAQVIFKSQEPACLRLLLQRARRDDRIKLFRGTTIKSVKMRGRRVVASCRRGDGGMELVGDVVLVACGREPNLSFASPGLLSGTKGFDGGAAPKRLYFVGDVKRGLSRQVGIAVGDGIAAAMDIIRLIDREDSNEDTW